MTITFVDKHTDKVIKVEDVKFFTTDATCLGVTGFDVHYNDGTFNIFNKKTFKLIMVTQ